jgi:hypothetical protein
MVPKSKWDILIVWLKLITMNGNNLLKPTLRDVRCFSFRAQASQKTWFKISCQIDSMQHISFTGTFSAEICFTNYETRLR